MHVPAFTLFARLFRFFSGRRKLLYAATLSLIILGAVASLNIEMREDIEAMLPDDTSSLAQDFRLLQSAPFTRKIIISVKGGPKSTPPELIETMDRLAKAIATPDITNIVTGPGELAGTSFNSWLTSALPNLVTEQDLSGIALQTSNAGVKEKLLESYERLLSPEGWALKGSIQDDPLSFNSIVMEKMRYLNMIPNMRLINGHFMSDDGKSTMLLADTKIPMTDSLLSGKLLEHLRTQVAQIVPSHMKVSIICGHRYTLANADAIKTDLFIILTLASLAVLAIYLVFLRSLSAIYVFLVPMSVLVIASGFISLTATNVFAVTIGFGGVLLGIADEYAMHVYFSCRKGSSDLATVIGEVSRPVLFGGMATLISFAVMLGSSLPGQRQLAIYTMAGIISSLLISLVVLPHLIKPALTQTLPPVIKSERIITLPRKWVIGVWLFFMLVCAWQSTTLRFNGDIRSVSLVPADLLSEEQELARTWGDMRGKAIIFAEGKSLDSALEKNDRLFRELSDKVPSGELVSIAPLLPSTATSRENRERWTDFWQKDRVATVAAALKKEGANLGFTPVAFAPFLNRLAGRAEPVALEELRSAGLGDIIDAMIISLPGSVRIMTLVPDRPELLASIAGDTAKIEGVRLVSQSRFGDSISRAISHDFLRYILLTSILVLLLVVVVFRNLKKILLALTPVVTGLLSMCGIMGFLGIQFNLFNIVATILIIGLCVDYGIFMVCKLTEGSDHAADRAVLVSGLTTLAGFGSLVLARHPAMHSIGVTVLLGIGFGIASALLVIPALYRKGSP